MDKTYTKYCKSCGNQIPEARVKILPHTVFCVPCAENKVTRKLAVTKLDGDIEHGATVIDIVESDEYGQRTTFNANLLEVEPDSVAPDKKPISIPSRKEYLE